MSVIRVFLAQIFVVILSVLLKVGILSVHLSVYYLLGKGGYVFGSAGLTVCLSVCLSVDSISQNVMNGLG